MRILLLTQVVPYPPDSGPKVKTFSLLQYLAERHEVHLLSFVRNAREEDAAVRLRRWCAGVQTVRLSRSRWRDGRFLVASVLSGESFLITRDDSTEMRLAVRRVLEENTIDAVHADQLNMAQFAVDLPVPLRILDEHNAVWSIVRRSASQLAWGPERLLAEWEWRKLRAYEGQVCRRFDQVLVVSQEDRAQLELAAGGAFPSTTIPITVDTQRLAFQPPAEATRDIVSVATMFYPPNVEGVGWFARDVFPRIREADRETRLFIVGSRPPRHIAALANSQNRVAVTGYVPDLDPILRQCRVFVVPLHSGSGMRVKILEAFARGIPVVSTTVGAEGIDVRAGEHLLIADDAAGFARAVVCLLQNHAEAARLAENGRRLVETRYDWRSALGPLDLVYPGLVGPFGRSFHAAAMVAESPTDRSIGSARDGEERT